MTTTTISDEQHRLRRATGRARRRGRVADRRLRCEDYRELTRPLRQDRQHRDVRGGRPAATTTTSSAPATACSRRTALMLLQTITVDDQWFPTITARQTGSRSTSFPAASWRRSARFSQSLARTTSLSLYHAENIGTHYARTLHAWRERFHRAPRRGARARASTSASSACGTCISATAKPRSSSGTPATCSCS